MFVLVLVGVGGARARAGVGSYWLSLAPGQTVVLRPRTVGKKEKGARLRARACRGARALRGVAGVCYSGRRKFDVR